MTNHYEILGVSKDADATEIKKVYRKLSLPDRNPYPEATEKYKTINEAHYKKDQLHNYRPSIPFLNNQQ